MRKTVARRLFLLMMVCALLMQTTAGAVIKVQPTNPAEMGVRKRAAKASLEQGNLAKSEDGKDNGVFEDPTLEHGGESCDGDDDKFKPGNGADEGTEAITDVTMPDWWSEASRVFKRNGTARVTDVRTGLSYNIKRMGGTNHADTEPLTAEDTAIMKRIYGGKWSWNRRAIIVEVNGKFYAASQNGMPHGQQTVYDNNYAGQFCIHFKNSRTHGGNAVCPLHQSAIAYAYNAYQGK